MSDKLEQLCSRARVLRAKWDRVPWCSLSIELNAVSRQTRCYVGVALIDRRQVGYLVNGEPRSFRLEPGDHTVTVYLARTARLNAVREATISRRIVLRPNEEVRLVCGRTSEMTEANRVLQKAQASLLRALVAGLIIVPGSTWLLLPFFREVAVYAMLGLGLGGFGLLAQYSQASWRAGTTAFALLVWILAVHMVIHVQYSRWKQSAQLRSLEPYFLVKAARFRTDDVTTTA